MLYHPEELQIRIFMWCWYICNNYILVQVMDRFRYFQEKKGVWGGMGASLVPVYEVSLLYENQN